MENPHGSQFFLAPQQSTHRRYEALRAVFVTGEPLAVVAQRFGYKVSALKSMVCRFRADYRRGVTPPFSFRTAADDLPGSAAGKTDTDRNYPRSPTVGN